jgi:hypothetical protein
MKTMKMRWAGYVAHMKLVPKLNQMFLSDHKTTSLSLLMLETVTGQRQVCCEEAPLFYFHLLVCVRLGTCADRR